MPTLVQSEGMAQLDPAIQVHIANLAKCGIKWTPPSERSAEPKPEEPSQVSPVAATILPFPVCKGPKHPGRAKTSIPDLPSEPESESEMMGFAYQEKLAAAKKKRNAVAQGPTISRVEAAKLDAEAFEDLGLKIGENGNKLETFIPWRFLVRYGVSSFRLYERQVPSRAIMKCPPLPFLLKHPQRTDMARRNFMSARPTSLPLSLTSTMRTSLTRRFGTFSTSMSQRLWPTTMTPSCSFAPLSSRLSSAKSTKSTASP